MGLDYLTSGSLAGFAILDFGLTETVDSGGDIEVQGAWQTIDLSPYITADTDAVYTLPFGAIFGFAHSVSTLCGASGSPRAGRWARGAPTTARPLVAKLGQ